MIDPSGSMTARTSSPAARVGQALYVLLFGVCLGMFVLSLYGQAVQWAFGDCAALYTVPGAETQCADWRAAIVNMGLTPTGMQVYFIGLRTGAAFPFVALSLLLMRRRGSERRVQLLAGLLLLLGVAGPIYNPFWQWSRAWFSTENQIPVIVSLSHGLDFLLSVGAVMFTFLFPDGRFVPSWSRWIAGLWTLIRLGAIFFPETPLSVYQWPFPLGVVLVTIIEALAVGAFAWRYHFRATPVQRQQIKWIIAGGLLLALNYGLDYGVWEIYPALTNEWLIMTHEQGVAWELIQDTLWYASQTIFAFCVGFAVFRRRLWDIDPILSRTLVYGALTTVIVAFYVLIVGGLGALFQAQTTVFSGLVATGIIAVFFQPLRERLQRLVDRWLYGERHDPVAILSRLAHHLETATTHSAILSSLLQTIASTLRIPHVAIHAPATPNRREVSASWGSAVTAPQIIPLVYQNEAIGSLMVAPRGPQEAFNHHEQRLLATIAALTATTVRAAQMTEELQHSRQRIITAREEERRRIRRDLHDGLGPALASLPLKIDAAIDLGERDALTSVRLLSEVKRQAQQLVADVRRVVHDLRPPALDELGLVEALRAAITQIRAPLHGPQISVEAGDLPQRFPAAVEAAAYHIVMEAVTNVLKHARAWHCWVVLRMEASPSALEITVEDDGIGLPPSFVSSVGLRSMRARAEELAGVFHLQRRPAGGTCIHVLLPVPETSDET